MESLHYIVIFLIFSQVSKKILGHPLSSIISRMERRRRQFFNRKIDWWTFQCLIGISKCYWLQENIMGLSVCFFLMFMYRDKQKPFTCLFWRRDLVWRSLSSVISKSILTYFHFWLAAHEAMNFSARNQRVKFLEASSPDHWISARYVDGFVEVEIDYKRVCYRDFHVHQRLWKDQLSYFCQFRCSLKDKLNKFHAGYPNNRKL